MRYRLEYPLKGGVVYLNNELILESTTNIKLFHSINKIYDNKKKLLVKYRFASFFCVKDIIILNQYLPSEFNIYNKLCSFSFSFENNEYMIKPNILNSYKLLFNNEVVAVAKGDSIFSRKYDIDFFIEDSRIHFYSLIVLLLALTEKAYNTI